MQQVRTFPLLHSQMGIYVAWAKRPLSTAYNLTIALPLSRKIVAQRLHEALNTVIQCRKVLKTRLMLDVEGQPRQFFDEGMCIHVERMRMEDEEVVNYAKKSFVKPYRLLGNEPLCRFAIIETTKHCWLLADFHHIIVDGISIARNFVSCDLDRAYRGLPLEPDDDGVAQMAASQDAEVGSPAYEKAKAFYHDLFRGKTLTQLVALKTEEGERLMQKAVMDRMEVERWTESHLVRPHLLFMAAFNIVLSRLSGADDVSYAMLLHGRTLRKYRNAYGMFVETVPVACQVPAQLPVVEYVRELSRVMLSSVRNNAYPYTHFCRDTQTALSMTFAFQGPDILEKCVFNGERVDGFQIPSGMTDGDISCIVYLVADRYEIRVDASSKLYGESFLEMFVQSVADCAVNIMQTPMTPVAELEITSAGTRQLIKNISSGGPLTVDRRLTVIDLLLRQAEAHPDDLAVSDTVGQLTYGELMGAANGLAHRLMSEGVGHGCFVGILAVPCCQFLIAAVGVMMAGAAYVPLDPAQPTDRCPAVRNKRLSKVISPQDVPVSTQAQQTTFVNLSSPDACAYVIYTSGSTGVPNGVMVSHEALNCFVRNIVNTFDLCPQSRIACHSSLTFDASIEDIFPVLTVGGSLFLMPEHIRRDLAQIHLFLDRYRITGGCYTTSLGLEIAKIPHPSLQYICLGGEKLNRLPQAACKVFNTYGPTEFTVDATCFEVTADGSGDIPIGRPLGGVDAFVVDQHAHLLPVGATGELCLAGPQMAMGYLGDEALTAEKFVDNPFGNGKMYRTGDWGRWNDNQQLEFIGRMDNLRKIHGYRISLDEVEQALSQIEGLREVAVVTEKSGDSTGMYAYFTADGSIRRSEMVRQLRELLPLFMIPDVIEQIQNMPHLPNGKIDKDALPVNSLRGQKVYVAPADRMEEALCEIFSVVLGVERVGVDDDFFALGGSSLIVMKVVLEAMKRKLSLEYGDVFRAPTPRLLADLLDKNRSAVPVVMDDFDFKPIHRMLDREKRIVAHRMKTVLLTGATGFLGAHLLHELLLDANRRIYCLVRADSQEMARKRLMDIWTFYFPSSAKGLPDRVIPVMGDLRDSHALDGLLSAGIEVVFHAAADVRHYAVGNAVMDNNLQSTDTVVAFCLAAKAMMVHVSTTSVAGFLPEGQDSPVALRENRLFVGQQFLDQYSLSKFLCERKVLSAVESDSLVAVVMRVGNLSPRMSDGAFQRDELKDSFLSSLRLIVTTGCLPLSIKEMSVVLSPVDVVARSIVNLTLNGGSCVSHVANPHGMPVCMLAEWMCKHGYGVSLVPDEEFADRLSDVSWNRGDVFGAAHALSAVGLSTVRQPVLCDVSKTVGSLTAMGLVWPAADGCLERFLPFLKSSR